MPSQSSYSIQLKEATQKLLDRIIQTDDKMESFDKFSELVVSYMRRKICEVTKDVQFMSSKRTKIWTEFHQMRLDNSGILHFAWKELLSRLSLDDSSLLMQSLYDEIYSLLVKEYFSSQSTAVQSPSSASAAVSFTDDELNAMRYACGYIPHVLLKKYEVRDGNIFAQYVECLGNMAVEGEGDNLLAYTSKWFTQVNRGGLFPLNDNSFSMFIEIEKSVRQLLPQSIIRNDNDKATFKKSVLDKIAKEENVQFYWTLLSSDIEKVENSEALLAEIISLWITIRGFSLSASWMEEYKKNKQKTIQKTTGLHKSIG